VPSEINIFPAPVAFEVVPIEPFGAVVVVVLAVIAEVKKYRPAVALATTGPVVAVEVNVPLTEEPVITASAIVVPETSSGSAKATPIGLVLAMIDPF
jgi:hypothetical protein